MAHVKTAITLPEDLFDKVAAQASREGRSRSSVIADAITAYIQALDDEEFTNRMNAAVAALTDSEWEQETLWIRRAGRTLFERLDAQDGGWNK